jgi:DNA polymerase-3 subunit gamma/tau
VPQGSLRRLQVRHGDFSAGLCPLEGGKRMAHLALYREWRPKVFDEVVEQKHAVYALRQAVISGQIGHAYLFSGTRGTGKTTLAKIFARAINCLEPQSGNPCNQCAICRGMLDGSLLDIVEMDAASNNSVDNIRRLCDEIVFMPAQARFKVYIIDEVHMLSTGAFNALLKTLEEPPAHAVFILATTEPHRIPATILSRCQRYEFRRIPVAGMMIRLAEIAKADGIDVSEDALQTIASLADGAMRDAISLLDQARASFASRIERDDVLNLAGIVQDEFMQQIAVALIRGDAPTLLELVDQLVMAGRDLARFVTDLAQHCRNVLICQISENPHLLVRAASDTLAGMRQLAQEVNGEQLVDLIKGLSALLSDLRWIADARTALEIGLIRLMGRTKPLPPALLVVPAEPAAPDWTVLPAIPKPTTVEKQELVPPPEDTDAPVPDEPIGLDSEPAAPQLPEPSAAPLSAAGLWQAILDQLMADGHMTLYLFSRSARPILNDHELQLHFAAADRVNFQETSQPSSIKILRATSSRLIGRDLAVQTMLDETAALPMAAPSVLSDENDWIKKIRKTADTLGIPVKMEE